MNQALDADALDQLFRNARTHNAWLPGEVRDEQLHQLYELMRFGPTSANCSPKSRVACLGTELGLA